MSLYGFYFKKLKNLRINKGLSPAQIAAVLGVDQQTILNHERGRIAPSLKMIKKYADLHGVNVVFFYLKRKDMKSENC